MIALTLLACGGPDLPEQQATWLTGFYFRWEFFNHRLSHLRVGLDDQQARVAVVGGTSTTSQVPEPLRDECDPEGCQEFPIFDFANVRVGWGRLTTSEAALGTGTARLDVGRAGGSTTITVPIPEGAKGEPAALIRGVLFDTDRELSGGPSCYRPRYGWHPRRMHAEITSVTLGEDEVEVEVAATFEAGATLDPERACIDAVHEQAVVGVEVDVLVVVGEGAVEDQRVEASAAYPWNGDPFAPEAQVEVAPQALSWSVAEPVAGWASVEFRFDQEDPEPRGAYLRSFGFEIGPDGASGVATNFSPGTQLEDMSYDFVGTARAIEVDGTLAAGTVEEQLPVELDDVSGDPIVYELDL